MEVYFEIIYVLHLFIIYISFMSTFILLDIDIDRNIRNRFIFLLSLSFFNLFFLKNYLWMVVYEGIIAYLFLKRKSIWFSFLFQLSRFIYLSFFKVIQPGSSIQYGVFIYSKTSSLWIHTLLCYVLFVFYGAYLSHYLDIKKEKRYLKQVQFSYRHHLYRCLAFYDSGNRVEYLNRPVLFIREDLIKEPLFIGKIDIKMINHTSRENIILLDWIEIEGKRKKYLYACLIKDLDYDMLLNGMN